jgi:uncharacterized membrane protein
MSASTQTLPTQRGRLLRVAALFVAAVITAATLILPPTGALQAALYLVLLSTLPGWSILIIAGRDSMNPLMTLVASVAISIAIVMTTSLVMAYLSAWLPRVIVLATAVLAGIAAITEFHRATRTDKE